MNDNLEMSAKYMFQCIILCESCEIVSNVLVNSIKWITDILKLLY